MSVTEIVLFIILFLLSGFFSGSEIALMSLPKHKVDSLVKNRRAGARSLKTIKENTDRLLILILIGNNFVNVYTAALATQIALNLSSSVGLDESQAVGISTLIVTAFLLLFGEIIPKSIASKNATSMSLLVAPIYNFLMVVLFPLIIFIELIIKMFSGKKKYEKMTGEEIQSFIDFGRAHGGIDDDEHERIKSIFEFSDTTAEEIMTPRVKIEAIPDTFTVRDAINYYLTHTHTRIPIYKGTIDKIDYFISARDLMKEVSSGNLDKKISEIKLRKVLKVPLNQPIPKLLDIFQKSNKIFAIIMDQYGGVAGLVTLEDIIEQVFGEIRDESDREAEEFVKTDDGKIITDSLVLMQDLLEEFDLEFENIGLDEKEFNGETISYVITDVLETFPIVGEEIRFSVTEEDDLKTKKEMIIKVLEVDEAKIGKVEARIEVLLDEKQNKQD